MGETIAQLLELLVSVGEAPWAALMERLLSAVREANGAEERRAIAGRVLQLYGGMGSFNDLVLQDAHGVRPEQDEFGRLRSLLFEAARDSIIGGRPSA
jgi:hypothetical protein